MSKESSIFEIEDSLKIETVLNLAPIIIITCAINYILPIWLFITFKSHLLKILLIILILNIIIGIGNIFTILFITKHIFPIHRVRFFISANKIEVYLQNELYHQIFWKDIEIIKIIKEKYSGTYFDSFQNKYNATFIGPKKHKSIRFFGLIFHKKKVGLILSALEQLSEVLNKKFIKTTQIKELSDEEFNRTLEKIKNFKQGLKEKNKIYDQD